MKVCNYYFGTYSSSRMVFVLYGSCSSGLFELDSVLVLTSDVSDVLLVAVADTTTTFPVLLALRLLSLIMSKKQILK